MRERRRLPLTEWSEAPHMCPRPVRLEVLQRMPLFVELTTAEIIDLEPQVQARGYQAGELIYRCGENANSLFVMASGTAKLIRPSAHGQDVVLHILGPGEGCGTLGILGQPEYPDSAVALTDSCALEVPAAVFHEAIEHHPRLGLTALGEVLHRLEQAQETIRRLSADNARQRVAAALLILADKLGDPQAETIALELPLTRTDLAALTGMTPETVSRVMSKLRDDGIVDTGRRWTTILDRPRLSAATEG
ncbi:Crp/Fnr family transcriptional regulator [Kocuria rosea]|nr:Crp/Fnr family transcriptional regulator [Kocuria rosea]QCY32960.1 Crp/Fnr family transcriptional regulator [Kocuria rosea]TQN33652.1 CRP/FNR family transcriptional regulator [Kocuria rosea]